MGMSGALPYKKDLQGLDILSDIWKCVVHCYMQWKWKSLSRVRLFVTPWPIQSMESSRPEYWSR